MSNYEVRGLDRCAPCSGLCISHFLLFMFYCLCYSPFMFHRVKSIINTPVVFEPDAYYTDLDLIIGLTKSPIPQGEMAESEI